MDGAFGEVAGGTTERECTNGARDAMAPRNRLWLGHRQSKHILFVKWFYQ